MTTTTTQTGRNGPGNTTETPKTETEGHYKDHARAHDSASLRVEPPEPAEDPVPAERSATLTWRVRSWRHIRALARRLHACSPYTDRPASIRDVVRHTFAGDWIPGERTWWLESLGYAYGILIAIPMAVLANSMQWVTHKKRRAFAFLVVCGLLWWAGYLWIVQRPCGWLGHLLVWFSAL